MKSSRRRNFSKIAGTVRAGVSLIGLVAAVEAHAQQVPRAVPVADPNNPPKATPVTPPATANPDEDLFAYATLCYTQNEYQIAIKPFLDYTRLYPKGQHASEAWFKLAECYLKTNQSEEARRAYGEVVNRFPKSESAASASYRLGAFAYNAREFARAANYFEQCEKLTTDALVRLASTYNRALALKQAGQKKAALSAYKAVVAAKGDNPYRNDALTEVASTALETGNKQDALEAFNVIIESSKDNTALGDALIKRGLIQNDLGKSEAALKDFKRALDLKELSRDLRAVAVFGLIQGYYAKGDYDTVIKTYTGNSTALPSEDLRPRMLLMVGNAQKQKQNYRQAIEVYLMIERQYPDAPEAFEAGYSKLLSFYQLGDKDIPQFTERFEERYRDKYRNHEYVLMARLIRADWYFSKGDYAKSAEAFAAIDPHKVPGKVLSSVLYKKGFAEAEAGKYNDAIGTLSEFISEFPQDGNIPAALAQRGTAYKNVRSFDKAIADFALIIKDHASNPAAEMAYYQSGLIKAETRDIPGMIADFEALVTKFPNSTAAADANYQIGRGYFDLKTKESYGKALAPLRKAVTLDSERWSDKCFQLIISCQYLREDVDGLAKDVDAYFDTKKGASISPAILKYLGGKFYERKDFKSSARYLRRLLNNADPAQTEDEVWNLFGMAQLENGEFDEALKAFDNFLTQTKQASAKPKALYNTARSQLGLMKFDDADATVAEGLSLVKTGPLNGQLQLLQGDIAYAKGNELLKAGDQAGAATAWKKAAGNYVVVSQIFEKFDFSPEALDKGSRLLEKLGEKDKADLLRRQLKERYPDYKSK